MIITLYDESSSKVIYHPKNPKTYVNVINGDIDEGINIVPSLNIELTPGLNIEKFKSFIRIEDFKTKELIFDGRVINNIEEMNSSGNFYNSVEAEGLLGILNDIYVRNFNIEGKYTKDVLNSMLYEFNKQTNYKYNFQVGIVSVNNTVSFDNSYETVLNTLLTLADITNLEVKARRGNNIIYIDMLSEIGIDTEIEVALGKNMLSITKELDTSEVASRVIALCNDEEGNTISVASVNGGKDYIEDSVAVEKYGVIETIVENTEITDAQTLLNWIKGRLHYYTYSKLIINCSLVDLAYLSNNPNVKKIGLGDWIIINNKVLDIYQKVRVLNISYNLFSRYNPIVELSSKRTLLTDTIIDLKNKISSNFRQSRKVNTISEVKFGDNITESTSILEKVNISGIIKNSYLDLILDRYTIYNENGIIYGTYPSNIKVYVNSTLIETITGGQAEEKRIYMTNFLKNGVNEIKINSDSKGRILARLINTVS